MPGSKVRPWIRVVWLTAVLAACGGGGGGGSGGGGGGNTLSGLIPASGPLGATLLADATRLRVLRPGATWRYAGRSIAGEHVNVVTQSSAASGVDEHASNGLGDGPDTYGVRFVGGEVRQRTSLPAFGLPEEVDFVELRSPVRVNDQITQFDRRLANAIDDLDGDGRAEALDIAVWTVVVGEETLDLAQRRGVRSVRVDTFIAARVRGSTGPVGEVVTGDQSVWYAEGIGIVRMRTRVPGNTPGIPDETTEELDAWDGLTEGLGGMPTTLALHPANGSALGPMEHGVRFDTHALLLRSGGDLGEHALHLVSVAPNARVIAVQEHAAANLDGIALAPELTRPLHRVGDGVVVIARQSAAPNAFALLRFDADGQRRPGGAVPIVDGAGHPLQGYIAATGDASSLWLLTLRRLDPANDPFLSNLELVGLDETGAARGPSTVLAAGIDARAMMAANLAAEGGRVLATWALSDVVSGSVTMHRYGVFDAADGALLAQRDLDLPFIAPTPLAADGLLALVTRSTLTYSRLAIARLDDAFDLVVGSTAGLGAEELAPAWDEAYGETSAVLGAGTIGLGVRQAIRRWPWQNNTESVLTVLDAPILPGRLAAANLTLAGRVELTSVNATLMVFDDRVLVYGARDGGTGLTSLWRPPR